jgi:hypothetical protein
VQFGFIVHRAVLCSSASVLTLALAGGGYFGYKAYAANAIMSERCEIVAVERDENGATPTITSGDRAVTVMGDSYTTGDHLTDPGQAWTRTVGESKNWTLTTAAVSYTGYINGGYCGNQEFRTRTAEVLKTNPDLLIIEGGLNDYESSEAEIQNAASELIESFEVIPNVVLIGPVDVPSREGEAKVDSALRAAASKHGAEYISALDWDVEFGADKTHMTERGHRTYAELVETELR